MRKCPFCGADISDESSFCIYCMRELDSKTKIAPPRNTGGKAAVIVLSAVLAGVLLIAAVTAAVYLRVTTAKGTPVSYPSADPAEGSSGGAAEYAGPGTDPYESAGESAAEAVSRGTGEDRSDADNSRGEESGSAGEKDDPGRGVSLQADESAAGAHVHTDACYVYVVDTPYRPAVYEYIKVVDTPYSPAVYGDIPVEKTDNGWRVSFDFARNYDSYDSPRRPGLEFSTTAEFEKWQEDNNAVQGRDFGFMINGTVTVGWGSDYLGKTMYFEAQPTARFTYVAYEYGLISPEQPEVSHLEKVLVTPEQAETGHLEKICGFD